MVRVKELRWMLDINWNFRWQKLCCWHHRSPSLAAVGPPFFFCIPSITNHSHSRDAASRALFWFNVLLKDTSTYRIRASGIKLYWCRSGRRAPWPTATVKLLILLSVWFQCWPSISQVVLLFPVPGPTWFHLVPPGPIWSHLCVLSGLP